jgi:hypothetical protein
MNNHTPSLAEVEARLAKLERQNRRLKRLGLLFLLLAGSGFLLAQASCKRPGAAPGAATPAATYDTLVVHRLELRDKAGKLRGVWEATNEGSRLELRDAIGYPRAALSVFASGPALDLTDPTGFPRVKLTEHCLRLVDAQLFWAVVGVTDLQTIRTGESHTTSAAAVTLFGKDGKVIWRAP